MNPNFDLEELIVGIGEPVWSSYCRASVDYQYETQCWIVKADGGYQGVLALAGGIRVFDVTRVGEPWPRMAKIKKDVRKAEQFFHAEYEKFLFQKK